MENQKIKSYVGKLLLPFGKPTVIITGWENQIDLFCERFIVFEGIKGQWTKNGLRTSISKQAHKTVYGLPDDKMLESFMENEGRTLAEADIFTLCVDLQEQLQHPEIAGSIDTTLSERDIYAPLFYLKKKNIESLQWMHKVTQQSKMKQLTELIAKIRIEENPY